MLGYEVNHLILFEWEVLIESLREFSYQTVFGFWLGLIYQIVLIMGWKRFRDVRCFLPLPFFATLVSGYFFHYEMFAPLFWPCRYVFWITLVFAALLGFDFLGKSVPSNPFSSIDEKVDQSVPQPVAQPAGKIRIVFFHCLGFGWIGFSAWVLEGVFLGPGNSFLGACFSGLALYFGKKSWTGILVQGIAMVYLLLAATVVCHFYLDPI